VSVSRDPHRTRERILTAALAEFSAKGFHGARVDRIARRSRVNKRMLYHYFGDKEQLYRAILRRKFAERSDFLEAAPDDPGAAMTYMYRVLHRDVDFIRMLEWEALEVGSGRVLAETERRQLFVKGVAKVKRAQSQGLIPSDVDPHQLLMTLVAVTLFPQLLPQMARLITGLPPSDSRFHRKRVVFLRWLAERLSGSIVKAPGRAGRDTAQLAPLRRTA
jgi:TetR/AcrR family transcriptional regulator